MGGGRSCGRGRVGLGALAATLAALALAPAAAHAQTPLDGAAYAFPVPDYVGALVGANSLDPGTGDGGKPSHPGKGKQRERRPTARQLARLRFRPAAPVTQDVYQRVIDQVGPGVDPTVLAGHLDAAKASFRGVLDRVGWSPRDVGDVAAFTLVQGYVTWHEITNVPGAGLKAVRREVRDNLARQKPVRRLSDARRQEIAEILELRVIFFLDARNDALALDDPAGVAAARAGFRDWTEEVFGVDVADLRLTRRGLVER